MRTYSLGVEVLSNIRAWHRSRTWNPVSFHTLLFVDYKYSYWSSLIIDFYFHLSQRQLGSDQTSMDRTHPETISETFGNEATSEGQMVKAMVLPSTIMMAIGGIMMRCGGRTNNFNIWGDRSVALFKWIRYQTSFWECWSPKESLTKSRSTHVFSCWDIGSTWHLLYQVRTCGASFSMQLGV